MLEIGYILDFTLYPVYIIIEFTNICSNELIKRSYVEPVQSNVEVLTYSLASRILLEDETNTARGIQVERFGKTLHYFSSNEVILSAGAIGSPQGL